MLCALLIRSLGGDLARGEVLRRRRHVALGGAHRGQAGLKVALRALARAVAEVGAVDERRLALRSV